MRSAGRLVPIQVQVTMETTGRMLVGSEIGAALTALSCSVAASQYTESQRTLR
jgi:5-methyltetrahydrofolate--homocysteine methyltransferase